MNSTFISGKTKWMSSISSENQLDHLEGILQTRHKTKSGEVKFDNFRFSIWGNTARRFHDDIKIGQIVAVKGYLTTGKTNTGATYTEICVEEYIPFIQTAAKPNAQIEPAMVKYATVKSAAAKLSADVDGDTVTNSQDSVEAMVSDELKASIARMASAQVEAERDSTAPNQVGTAQPDKIHEDSEAEQTANPMEPAVDDPSIIALPDDENVQNADIPSSAVAEHDDTNTESIATNQVTE